MHEQHLGALASSPTLPHDMDTGLDYFDLDSQLPSQEEVCPSYGKVASQILFMNKWAQQFYRLKMST